MFISSASSSFFEEISKKGEAQRQVVNSEMDHLRELIETKRRQLLQKSALEEKQKRVQLQEDQYLIQSISYIIYIESYNIIILIGLYIVIYILLLILLKSKLS